MPERDWEKDWKLCERATSGPWYAIPHPECKSANWRVDTRPDVPWANFGELAYMSAEDARFVAEAREALPYWLLRVKKLEAVTKAAEGVKMCFHWCYSECFPFNEQGCPYHKSDKCWLAELFKALETLKKEE